MAAPSTKSTRQPRARSCSASANSGARAVAAADQHAADRLAGQRERPAERADDVDRRRARRSPASHAVPVPVHREDDLDGAAVDAALAATR